MEMYDSNKSQIWETEAMLHHLARQNPSANLHGANPI